MKRFALFTGVCAQHGFLIKSGGELCGFGRNQNGQLGSGDQSFVNTLVSVKFFNKRKPTNVVDIGVGEHHTIFMTKEGKLFGSGVLGIKGSTGNITKPESILFKGCKTVKHVSCGGTFSFFLTKRGTYFGCGKNSYGELGLGDYSPRNIPTENKTLTNVESIHSGRDTAAFFCKDRKIFVTGNNSDERLPAGAKGKITVPTQVTFFEKGNLRVQQLHVGSYHISYITNNGDFYVSGYYKNGNTPQRSVEKIGLVSECLEASGGYCSTIVRTRNGLFACGTNNSSYGFLGMGNNVNYQQMTPIPSMKDKTIVEMQSGYYTNYFVTKSGDIWGCGMNKAGQLFTGNDENMQNVRHLSTTFVLKRLSEQAVDNSRHKEYIERFDFVCENEEDRDLVIVTPKSKILLFKSIVYGKDVFKLIKNKGKIGVLEIADELNISADSFLNLLFCAGTEKSIFRKPEDYLYYYEFFMALKMKQYANAILQKLGRIQNVKDLLMLFKMSFQKYEEKRDFVDDDDLDKESDAPIQFQSEFCRQLFKVLKMNVNEIRKNRSFRRVLEKLLVFGDLYDFTGDGYNISTDANKTFLELYRIQLKLLFAKRELFPNLIVVANDKKEIPVHKEVLLTESEYFFKVMKFGGKETEKPGYLILERLNYDQLFMLVRYHYTGELKVTEKNIGDSFQLLLEVFPYFGEEQFKTKMVAELCASPQNLTRESSFLEFFREYAYLFHDNTNDIPEDLKETFLRKWARNISGDRLKNIIENSLKEKENRKNEQEMEFLKRKIVVLERKVAEQDQTIRKMMKRLDELEKK